MITLLCIRYSLVIGYEEYLLLARYIRIALGFAGCYISMISYVALSLLKMFAVIRPFQYRSVVTLRKIVVIVAIR
jgi:hypothetical protein